METEKAESKEQKACKTTRTHTHTRAIGCAVSGAGKERKQPSRTITMAKSLTSHVKVLAKGILCHSYSFSILPSFLQCVRGLLAEFTIIATVESSLCAVYMCNVSRLNHSITGSSPSTRIPTAKVACYFAG